MLLLLSYIKCLFVLGLYAFIGRKMLQDWIKKIAQEQNTLQLLFHNFSKDYLYLDERLNHQRFLCDKITP